MKKGFSFIFLFFAIIFTLPTILMITSMPGEDFPFIGILIFAFFDIILWALFFSGVVKSVRNKRVITNGTEFTATFVSFGSNVAVNNVPMFYITYTWKNEQGEQKEGKSSSDYTIHEAEAFEKAKNFKIKVLGKHSAIITKPSELIVKLKDGAISDEGKVSCEYCSAVFNQEENKCPHCGAPRGE